MPRQPQQREQRKPAGWMPGQGGLRLGSVFGVELVADWSLAIIFALIAFSLSVGVFPAWHPDWSPVLNWTIGIVAAVLFFASIAAHELSHALVGRSQGIPIRRVTLFVFGGMAHMEREPPDPRSELLMAVVGPITSAVIGVIGTWIGLAIVGEDVTAETLATRAGPVASLLLWLGPINIALAVFNLVPGFPLDGGRVFRAILWWATGSLDRATHYASLVGQGFAWLLITVGVLMAFGVRVPYLGAGLVSGLWLVLIGWFLNNAARYSYRQLRVSRALQDVPVRELMRRQIHRVPVEISLDRFVHDYLMAVEQSSFPVERDGRLVGMIALEDVRSRPREEWTVTRVGDVMTPAEQLSTLGPEDPAAEALGELGQVRQIPVIATDGELLGMVRRDDVVKWLSLHTRGAA